MRDSFNYKWQIEKEMRLVTTPGSSFRAVTSTKNQQLFEAVALKLWPKSSETPEQCGHEEYLSIEKRLMPHFDNFASLINPNELVEASIYWPPPSTATSQVNIYRGDWV